MKIGLVWRHTSPDRFFREEPDFLTNRKIPVPSKPACRRKAQLAEGFEPPTL